MAHRTHGRLIERLSAISSFDERLVLGLSSGTSFDGIDAALVRISGSGPDSLIEPLAFNCVPFSEELACRIAASASADTREICRLNFDIGEAFGQAALDLISDRGRRPSDVHLIGSHGQTVYHDPPSDVGPGATLQIGEPDVIARRTGIVTIGGFRTADVAAGGSGAPLIPYVDWLMFRRPDCPRVMVNIGGIANLTYVVEDLSDVIAFDTGPGNSLVDEIARCASGGTLTMDEGGRAGLAGAPIVSAAAEFLRRPYFSKGPPKSTGRETFGREAALELCQIVYPDGAPSTLSETELCDLIATAAYVTARSIRDAVRLLPGERAVSEVVVSGGGLKNGAIMSYLSRLFEPVPVFGLDRLGVDPDAKEAVGFAVLANETLFGRPGNVPSATGAPARVVLGKISCGL